MLNEKENLPSLVALRAWWQILLAFIFYLINWNNKCALWETSTWLPVPIALREMQFWPPEQQLWLWICSSQLPPSPAAYSLALCSASPVAAERFRSSVQLSALLPARCSAALPARWEWMLSQVLHALRSAACFQTNGRWQFGMAVLQIFRTTSSFCWNMNRKCCMLEWAVPAVLLSSCGHPLPLCCFAPLPALPPVGQFLPPGAVSHPEGLSWKFKFKKCVVMALTICYDCIMNCQ